MDRPGFTKMMDVPPGYMPLLGEWGIIGCVKVLEGDWFSNDRKMQSANVVFLTSPDNPARYAYLDGDGVRIKVIKPYNKDENKFQPQG